MVETTLSGASPLPHRVTPAAAVAPTHRVEPTNPDGSAIPDIIANHHRPEDLGDHSNQDVSNDGGRGDALFGDDGLTFGDILDVINPLQHIPVVSTIYRAVTGDEISPGARVAGGALFGGPIGFAVAAANAVVEAATGDDIGETIVAMVTGDPAESTVKGPGRETPSGRAISIAEADPAIVRAGTLPISLLPTSTSLPSTAASFSPARPHPQKVAKLPFGGLGALPFTNVQPSANDPVSALLQARAAVPSAGPIPNLGNRGVSASNPAAAMPTIDTRLADKLSALAVQNPAIKSPTRAGQKEDQRHSGTVPTPLVPQRMTDTLDRYEHMTKAEPPAR